MGPLSVGIDEVGRGSIAGPLVVGVVALRHNIMGLRDSKALTSIKRLALAQKIYKEATFFGLGWVSAAEIDHIGLTKAHTLASKRALTNSALPSSTKFLLDGNFNYLPKDISPVELIVNGDALVPAISAASIIAKVARDNFMYNLALFYPSYGFNRHVGYATAAHLKAIKECGISPYHRKTFEPIKSILQT
jgi:ribonuclease HII